MEETIGYEALFSTEEWNALMSGDWSDLPVDEFPDVQRKEGTKHSVFVANPPGHYEGNEERYELECDVCDYIGAADTAEEAQAIAQLHEAFVATLVEQWSVDR